MTGTQKQKLWHAEIEPRLQKSELYQRFNELGREDSYHSHMHSTLIDTIEFCHQRSKTILTLLPEYTLHDSGHLFRVLELAEKLIHDNGGIDAMSLVDCYVLISTIFLHDIGLAPTKPEVNAWRKQVRSPHVPKNQQSASISNFIRTYPKKLALFNEYRSSGDTDKAQRIENEFISEFIRETHGARSQRIVQRDLKDGIRYRGVDLRPYIGKICKSHIEDARSINGFDSIVPCGEDVFFSPRFCAVVLRLADLIDFDSKRAPKSLFEAISVESAVSLNEWQKHRSITAWTVRSDMIALSADCDHPLIQDGILEYCNIIDDELPKCNSILSAINSRLHRHEKYSSVKFQDHVDREYIRPKLGPDGQELYRFSKTRFTLDQDKVVDLLMGTSLYGNPAVALRELLQNSIDACLVRQAFEERWENPYTPDISITFDEQDGRQTVVVKDNGIGMDEEVIENYYSKVGACFYSSPDFYLMLAEHDVTFVPISRFGIGVLSYFLVSNTIEVTSRRVTAKNNFSPAITVRVDGVNGIFWLERSERMELGTVTKLELMEDHPWRKLSSEETLDAVKSIIPQPPFNVTVNVGSYSETISVESNVPPLPKLPQLKYPEVHAEIRVEDVELFSKELGFSYSGKIGWLEAGGAPVRTFETLSKGVSIKGDNSTFKLENSMEIRANRITQWSGGLEIVEGEVQSVRLYREILKSNVQLSLHGFHVPFDPFGTGSANEEDDEDEGLKPRCKLALRIYLSGSVRVFSPGDLNLNAARDNVLPDEKWYSLRDWLTKQILGYASSTLGYNERKQFLSLISPADVEPWLQEIIDTFY